MFYLIYLVQSGYCIQKDPYAALLESQAVDSEELCGLSVCRGIFDSGSPSLGR